MKYFRASLSCPIAVVFILLSTGAEGMRVDVALQRADVRDYIFTQDLLWTSECTTLTSCAINCMSSDQCISFTLSSVLPTGKRRCRGHASHFSNATPERVPETGARLYRLQKRAETSLSQNSPGVTTEEFTTSGNLAVITTSLAVNSFQNSAWMWKVCFSNSNCLASNTECILWKCMCAPGYYYSYTKDSCVSSCDSGNLGEEFLEYPLVYIVDNNMYAYYGKTVAECKALCISTPNCRSMDYRFLDKSCTGASVTKLDVPPSAWVGSGWEIINYYQRSCA